MRFLLLPCLLLLAGCGSAPPPEAAPVDETLRREQDAGATAYSLEHAEEAVARYRAALLRAQARDDLEAIGNLGYNLAVAELRANAPKEALNVARTTRAELERRGVVPFPALLLVEATALYRTGAASEADALAARVAGGSDAAATARATFLRGLIADERGDEAGLSAAVTALGHGNTTALAADAAELSARLLLRRGESARAATEARRAAALRQEALDYRGLARTLALAGEATRRTGDSLTAADLFLRAGRSAAAQGDPAMARPWLEQAASLAPGQSAGEAASELLLALDHGEE